jgi:hypothetical protein
MPQSFRMQFGYWDEASQTITLQMTTYQLVEQPGAHPGFRAALLFEGSQFPTPAQPEPGQDVVWTLAGQFTALAPLITPPPLFLVSPSPRRHRFGWRATHEQTL